jgi:hypothetical protein
MLLVSRKQVRILSQIFWNLASNFGVSVLNRKKAWGKKKTQKHELLLSLHVEICVWLLLDYDWGLCE